MAYVNPNRRVRGKYERRARQRLARVRLSNPRALPHVNPRDGFTRREAIRIRHASRRLPRPITKRTTVDRKPKPYVFDPLAPLTPSTAEQELAAQARLRFGPAESAINQEIAAGQQTVANTGTYYDDYKKALEESAARIRANNEAQAQAAQASVEAGARQESDRIAAENAQQAAQAAKFGRPAAPSQEGAQAVAAERARGTDEVTRLRQQGSADYGYAEKQAANSSLAKIEAVNRDRGRLREAMSKRTQLASEKGDFTIAQRQAMRDSERTYALARKEFGLKTKATNADIAATKSRISADKQAKNAQVLVAKIYAAADRAQARAQIRVAKLQLKKGKISKHQYRTIENIYKGLPKKGRAPQSKSAAPRGSGSGPGGSLAPWERDARDRALNGFRTNQYGPEDKARAISKATQAGIPARLARAAWRQYAKTLRNSATAEAPERAPRGAHGKI